METEVYTIGSTVELDSPDGPGQFEVRCGNYGGQQSRSQLDSLSGITKS